MKTIKINLKHTGYLYNDEFIKIGFKDAMKKVIDGKAGIRLELTDDKKVFNIVCNDGETIYINRNTVPVFKNNESNRKDYNGTTKIVKCTISNICNGITEEK